MSPCGRARRRGRAVPGDGAPRPRHALADDDATRLITFLNHVGIDVGKDIVRDVVRMVGLRQKYHPVREYLDGIQWDGTKRLGTWLARYLGADDNDYNRKAGTWWMVQALRLYELAEGELLNRASKEALKQYIGQPFDN